MKKPDKPRSGKLEKILLGAVIGAAVGSVVGVGLNAKKGPGNATDVAGNPIDKSQKSDKDKPQSLLRKLRLYLRKRNAAKNSN